MTVDLTRLVKPLVFEQCAAGLWSSGLALGGEYRIKLTGGRGFQVSRGMLAIPDNTHWFLDLEAAQAAANADYAAHVLAAIDTALLAELVEALRAISETSNYTRASWMQDTARAALAKLNGGAP